MKEARKKNQALTKFNTSLMESNEGAAMTPDIKAKFIAASELTGIPPFGFTMLGGRLYINSTGIDVKVLEGELRKRYKVKGIKTISIQRPTKDNGYLAGFKGIIELFDTPERDRLRQEIIIEALKVNKTKEEIYDILETSGMLPPRFEDEGWTDPNTCQAIAFPYVWNSTAGKKLPMTEKVLIGNINMMGIRKATNRAKNQLTGVGFTSLDEVSYNIDETTQPISAKQTTQPGDKPRKIIDKNARPKNLFDEKK
jgi:hypothetical protein